jgi:hypothetical protein
LPSGIPAQQTADVLTSRLQWKHDQGVTALAMSPDGKLIATAGQLITYATATTPGYTVGEARLWNAQTGAHMRSFTVQNDKIASLTFSADSKLLAAGGGNEQLPHDSIRITVWDVASGTLNRTLDGYAEDVTHLSFLGDSDGLVAIGYARPISQNVLKMWEGRANDARGSEVGWTITWPLTSGFGFGRNKAGDVLLAVTSLVEGPWDRDIRKPGQAVVELWNLKEKSKTAMRADGAMSSMNFREASVSLNGSVVAAGNAWTVEAWGIANMLHFTMKSDYPNELFGKIALSPDGSTLAVISQFPGAPGRQARARVRLWDLPSNTLIGKVYEGDDAPTLIRPLMFSPDGSSLVTADDDGNIKVWDVKRRGGR